jgi:excisionase family DNA binding protein
LTEITKKARKGALEFLMSKTSRSNPPRTSNELPNSTDLVERLEASRSALRARDLAEMFGVTQQHIYKMAALGVIPSFRVGASVRFDPGTIAEWLKRRMSVVQTPVSQVRIAV